MCYSLHFGKGIQQLSTFFFLTFHRVFRLVRSTHLALPSLKEFANGLRFSPTHFHAVYLQQRSCSTDGKSPAFAFRLLIMKNTAPFFKYYMNPSHNSEPEITIFSGQHSALQSLLLWPASCLQRSLPCLSFNCLLLCFLWFGLFPPFPSCLSHSGFLQGFLQGSVPSLSAQSFLLKGAPTEITLRSAGAQHPPSGNLYFCFFQYYQARINSAT